MDHFGTVVDYNPQLAEEFKAKGYKVQRTMTVYYRDGSTVTLLYDNDEYRGLLHDFVVKRTMNIRH